MYAAVGTPAASMTSLAYALEPSSCAASAVGPNATTPASTQRSTNPATSGTSGPTTTRSIPAAAIAAGSSAPANGAASRAIPAFPGEQSTSGACGERSSARTMACSRPPPPMTRTRVKEPR